MGLLVWKSLLYQCNFKLRLCVFCRPLFPGHLLFLISCVTFYSLLGNHIFLTLYCLVTLMSILTLKHQHVDSISMPRHRVWRYKHADFDRANELLCDMDRDDILNSYDIQMSWKRFKSAFLDVMEQCLCSRREWTSKFPYCMYLLYQDTCRSVPSPYMFV